MERAMKLWTIQNTFFIAFLCVCITAKLRADESRDNERKTYIVYMGGLPKNTMSLTDAHNSLLSEAIGDAAIATTSKIHTYEKSFNGFAALLLPREAELLSQKEGVVSVFQNQVRRLVTTRSWDFIGMPLNITRNHQTESDTIVGVIDSGVWPDSASFDDTGFGPPPSKWKGKCDQGPNFTRCNNKLIGARYFNIGGSVAPAVATPGDMEGHGTHVAATAAGNAVEGADLYGISQGTARGGVPSSRIASYKVCWGWAGCQDVDILAAFDAAIAEGVDVISLSIAGGSQNYMDNSITIGSFHAVRQGILTVCAAGNNGPGLWMVANIAPWVVTVGASTVDRRLASDVVLGDGQRISGTAINVYEPKKQLYPLTSGAKARNSTADLANKASSCLEGTLSKVKVEGRVVYCSRSGSPESVISKLGGVGIINAQDNYANDITIATINGPGTFITAKNGAIIDKYINSTRSPRAVIMKTMAIQTDDAPAAASFSSRGPQTTSPFILKPDIAAPGVNILAAYSKHSTLTGQEGDNRIVRYNIQSGTSMSCPHVAGAAAYVKTFHPNWSPAAIRSALMTTAKEMKVKPPEAELAYGSGVVNPKDAINPGLVYDIDTTSYISFLCKEGYTDQQIATLTGDAKHSCSNVPKAKGSDGLNYPSVYLQLARKDTDFYAEFHRTVTNVGDENGDKTVSYKAAVAAPKELSITVDPSVLTFDKGNKTMSFTVVLKGKFPQKRNTRVLSGLVTWTDSVHRVRTPVAVFRTNF